MKDVSKQVTIARDAQQLAPFAAFIERTHLHPAAAFHVITASDSREAPCVAVLHDGSEPKAMIVARTACSELEWKLGYAQLGSSRARVARVVTGGFLGDLSDDQDAALLCQGLLKYLREGGADLVHLDGVPTGSALHRAALSARRGPLHTVTSPQAHWWLELPDSAEEFLRSRSSNTKSMIRQCKNRVARTFGEQVELRCFRAPSEVKTALEQIEMVASKSYQRALKVGFIPSSELEHQANYDAQNGWFAAFVLYLGGKPCAYWNGSIYRGIFTSYATGFDPALASCQPGTFLLLSMIEHFYRTAEVRSIDFGAGEADYKRKFGSENREEVTLMLFAASARGLALALLSNGTSFTNALARRALGGPALQRLKALWRRRLQREVEPARPESSVPSSASSSRAKGSARGGATHKDSGPQSRRPVPPPDVRARQVTS